MKTIAVYSSVLFVCFFTIPQTLNAKPNASVKFSTQRVENANDTQETLILPFAFPSDSMGTTFGVGSMAKGYGQDQLLIAGAAWGSVDEAVGGVLGLWDYQLPFGDRIFFSTLGSLGNYPRQRAYSSVPRITDSSGAGGNDSDENDYVEEEGTDNWIEFKFEYVLPIGSMTSASMGTYKLEKGILTEGATGGEKWNPLETGVSVLVLKQSNRFQDYQTSNGDVKGTVHPVEFGYLYNNTDFPTNPSKGSSQYLSFTQDFGWGESKDKWNFLSFEASKYFDVGTNKFAKQQVVALNFWTGDSPSWDETTLDNDTSVISDDPPFLEGARLGGFYRMRAYPNNRFNDKSVIYTTGEYRLTPKWNPIANVNWLKFLKLDWFQLVGFAEGGRVAGDYGDLFSDWKFDGGVGLRAMVAGGVVRFDVATSEESTSGWVMFGHPF